MRVNQDLPGSGAGGGVDEAWVVRAEWRVRKSE